MRRTGFWGSCLKQSAETPYQTPQANTPINPQQSAERETPYQTPPYQINLPEVTAKLPRSYHEVTTQTLKIFCEPFKLKVFSFFFAPRPPQNSSFQHFFQVPKTKKTLIIHTLKQPFREMLSVGGSCNFAAFLLIQFHFAT